MVRKDFILQNFVGTGGLVDARAVRCHERIARWHCLCEHQLCHINDFCVMQSQQNVQELGQTMKTLNQFYDDAMGRALMEVPDESGRETRTDFAEAGGTTAEIIQGTNPVDYDGQPLANAAPRTNGRLISKHLAQRPHHGTAEPEMRGLYILLTIDNDGGLEVNKYASRLFEERPEVYHTEPVQLALSVYKVRDLRLFCLWDM
jgi:SAC3/GANP family